MVEIDAMYQRTDFMLQNWSLTLEEAKKQEVVDQMIKNIENTL